MTEVGKVYAQALFLLAQEEKQAKQVYQELNAAADVMAQNPEFVMLLDVPTLGIEERLSVLRKVIGEDHGIMENFLCLLVEKRRFASLEDIRAAYNKVYHEAFGIAEVFVTTAVPLEEAQRSALIQKMKQKLGKEIELRETTDASLLGGMIVQYGDTRLDNSLRTRMQQFRQT